MGFGGLNDLSVISDTGIQVAYAGPFKLEGKNYSDQDWFIECQKHNLYISEIFRGYREIPHMIIAVKSYSTRRFVFHFKGYAGNSTAHSNPVFL